MEHYRVACCKCGTIEAQCRCPGPKETKYILCAKCASVVDDDQFRAGIKCSSIMVNDDQLNDDLNEIMRIKTYCTGCGVSKVSLFARPGLNISAICDLCGETMKWDIG